MKPKVAIILAGNQAIDFCIANVIIGLKKYSQNLIDKIFIYHELNDETQINITKIWQEKIQFIKFTYDDFILEVGENHGIIMPKNSRWGAFYIRKILYF